MLITTGDAVQVKSAVSGPVADFMPADIGAVLESLPGGPGVALWTQGEAVNTLTELVAGNIYYAVSSADVEVPAFVSTVDESAVASSEQTLLAESVDNDYGLAPGIFLPNDTTSILRLFAVGRDGLGFGAGVQVIVLAAVDSGGVVTVLDSEAIYIFGDVDFGYDLDTNKIIPKLKNTTASYTGVTKWALTVNNTQVKYALAP